MFVSSIARQFSPRCLSNVLCRRPRVSLLLAFHDPVADSRLGEEAGGVARVLAQLAPEPSQVRGERSQVVRFPGTPATSRKQFCVSSK